MEQWSQQVHLFALTMSQEPRFTSHAPITLAAGTQRLPIELQTHILCSLLAEEEVWADYTEAVDFVDDDCLYEEPKRYTKRDSTAISCRNTPIYALDAQRVAQLEAWTSIFVPKARLPWEGQVTFNFMSPVAMLDVLLSDSFPFNRRSLIRRIKVNGYPLPLYGFDDISYTTHSFEYVLEIVTGLQLDTLVYENVFLREDDGWGRRALPYELEGMLASPGWQTLEFLTVRTELTSAEVDSLIKSAAGIRKSRDEPDFKFALPTTNVESDTNGQIWRARVQPTVTVPLQSAQRVIIHPRPDRIDFDGKVRPLMTAKRGTSADIQPRGLIEDSFGVLGELLKSMSWRNIRLKGKYLVDEGIDDPNRHL